MSKRKRTAAEERILAAAKKKFAAQAKIAESLKQRSPGSDMVVRVIEGQYELSLAKAELFKEILADVEEKLRHE